MSLSSFTFELGIALYRSTIKRSRYLHAMSYKAAQKIAMPIIERSSAFYTVPDDSLQFRLKLLAGDWEKETVKLANQLIKPGMTVLDIGANVGYYSRLFSKLVGNTGQVIAFEPHPVTFGMLVKNVDPLKNVIPIQMAVSDRETNVELYEHIEGSGASSLRHIPQRDDYTRKHTTGEIAPRILKGVSTIPYMVNAATLDSALKARGIEEVDLIKIDIEGAEGHALRGMMRTIDASPCLSMIMEFYPLGLRSFGVEPEMLIQNLQNCFSRIEIIQDNGNLSHVEDTDLNLLISNLTEGAGSVNLLCQKG